MSYNIEHKHMKDNLILQDKNYISAKRASIIFGYTSDYVGQLCRSGKLECKMIGRSWFVSEESVIKHRETVAENTSVISATTVASAPIAVSIVSIDTKTTFTVSLLLLDSPKLVLVQPILVEESPIVSPIVVESLISPIAISARTSSDTDLNTLVIDNKNNLKKLVLVSAFFVFAFLFIFRSFVFAPSLNGSNTVASVISVSKDIASGIINSLSMIPNFASNIFDHGSIYDKQGLAKVDKPPPVNSSSESFGGLAVVPSSQSVAKDELLKQKIRDSFSDEVEVKPDKSGTAGIITPVFRKVKGDDFVYVMVPVKN